ncbi:MAG: hypothetical protein ACI97A_000855 [Planctomycetota bacterium]|jgi:hypothetical protein
MKYFKSFIFVLLLGLLSACSGEVPDEENPAEVIADSGPKIEVTAAVDSPQVDIGARVKYRVEVKFREGVEIDWPPILEQLDHQIVYDAGIWTEEDPVGNYRIRSMEVVLDPGIDEVLTIAPTAIRWRETVEQDWVEEKTDAITVEVVSVSEGAPEFQEPLDIFELPQERAEIAKKDGTTVLLIIGGSLLILAVAAFFLLRAKKRAAVPVLSAEEVATKELDHLETLQLLEQGEVKEFYYRLTAIIRRYIELRFEIMASEQTTEEFLSSMKLDQRLSANEKDVLQQFLSTADLVRYALHEPPTSEVAAALAMARSFVDREPAILTENEEMSHAV